MFKCRLQPFFETFLEEVNYSNAISNKSLNICTVRVCVEKFSEKHFNKHPICPFARTYQSNELIHYFPNEELNDENGLIRHFKDHDICFNAQMFCLTCQDEIGDCNGNASIGSLLDHEGIHKLDMHSV